MNKISKYKLDADISNQESVIYAFQNLIIFLASAIVMPIVVGQTLGLDQPQIAQMLQRTFFLCGIVTFVQVRWGHGLPIQDGPAGLWSGIYISVATLTTNSGGSLETLRANLEMALMISGCLVMLLVCTNLLRVISRFFTGTINGIVIILMTLQISASIMKGFIGYKFEDSVEKQKAFFVAVVTLVTIFGLLRFAKGFLKSIATFVGVAVGWILAACLGISGSKLDTGNRIFGLPEVFAWGEPAFDVGIVITCVIGATVLLSMSFASIEGIGNAVYGKTKPEQIRRGIFFHGAAEILAGIFPTIGFMPYVSSIGIVEMTGVAAKKPFYLVAAGMVLMGLLPGVGAFFASIPEPVGNGALLVIFALCLTQGIKQIVQSGFDQRSEYVTGVSLMIGAGVMFLPSDTFDGLPTLAVCLLSNGLIVGVAAALVLDRILSGMK